ncbi:MAG: class I SAM-dependent methyltransferase [Planctomycetota bacterium]
MRRVLCAGNGLSQEPKALAQAGFDVVALDLSPLAVELAREVEFRTEVFANYCEPEMRRPGGHVDFVVGDILDPAVCPGPFDVVIERRTAQIFAPDVGAILQALADRVGRDGILFSHCHAGASKRPAKPRHCSRPWFQQHRWTTWSGDPGHKPAGRVAWLFTSTG